MLRMTRLMCIAVLGSALLPHAVAAALLPSEIAIVAALGDRESERLAEYYAQERGIPSENICKVVLPKGETISREKWRWAVRPEIRKWLTDHDPQQQIRCLVTVWGVPLRIGRAEKDSPALARYREYLEGERAKRLKVLADVVAQFDTIAPGVAGGSSANQAKTDASDGQQKSEFQLLRDRLERALQAAQGRIRRLTDPQEQQAALVKIQQYSTLVGGIQVLAQSLQNRLQSEADATAKGKLQGEMERLRGMLLAYAQVRQHLESAASGIERDSALLEVITSMGGVVQTVPWLDEQLKTVTKNETQASFDGELSLVMWPDDYALLRWQPNYLLPRFDSSQLRDTYRTLMVSRIDAPTLRLAKGLIDTAIQVEPTGLQGKFYIDTRGIGKRDKPDVAPGSYADFDRSLLATAKGVEEQTTIEVVLDEKTELFQPGDCPDAALYCGWYSLGKYVDAFDWKPGAVAYHLASAEATTLHKEESEVWCKKLLEDGVCATIGPVNEPYLISFPRPNEFFSLLLQGNLTLVECYYRTKPFNSWMQVLVGDPLYRPFAKSNIMK